MSVKDYKDLAATMAGRRKHREPPYTLFLGSEVLLAAGMPARELYSRMLADAGSVIPADGIRTTSELLLALEELSRRPDGAERLQEMGYRYRKEAEPPPAYRHLAGLVKEGYFRLILTCGIDTFLDQALYDVGFSRGDTLVIDPVAREADYSLEQIASIRLAIFRLRGSLYRRESLRFSQELVYNPSMMEFMAHSAGDGLVMVGFHAMDGFLNPVVEAAKELWYANYQPYDQLEPLIRDRTADMPERLVLGPQGELNIFFANLADQLLYQEKSLNIRQQVDSNSTEYTQTVIARGSSSVVVGATIDSAASKGSPIKKSSDAETLDSLKRLLSQASQSYYDLNRQAARYGSNVPLNLKNQIESRRREMDQLQVQINDILAKTG